ncbi:MAG TPA: hypothetical protein PKJ33_01575, partial [Alphaproteobacteria bacterium]|nr:hypothetical protein [Alphaproteobacteria bacterium]
DSGAVNKSEIAGFLKDSCYDTIGANKFCYATFVGNGVMPTNSQLQDEDNKDTIYSDAYSSRMNDSMKSKIDDLITTFDKKTKQKCQDTITSCAMRTCGQGSGAACYASAFDSDNTIKGVTNPTTLADIKYGCEAVVNNDTYCKYSVVTFQSATGIISYLSGSLFDILFTAANDTTATNPDAVGAVAALNSKLSLSYNQSSLDNMKRQCQAIATGCVKSMCGEDYSNCYRNRTDVYSVLTNTGSASFDKSMNKVGGVLDHTIIIGLCMNSVKNNPTCEEHIKAESARRTTGPSTADSWGTGVTDTRTGWLDSGTYSATSSGNIQDTDADGNLLCTTGANGTGDAGRCDSSNGRYVYPKMVSENAYNIAQSERSVFNDLIYDLEIEAQAKYNAKLTKQQNMCLSDNEGGIIGARENGSTYMWVKMKSAKVPASYASNGLKDSQFSASNDLYGSFCRIRITLQSDDKDIQDAINSGKDWSTAYYAAGDSFTCGSWIPGSELEAIANKVAARETGTSSSGKMTKGQRWLTAGTSVLGAVGGGIATNYLQKGSLGGLLGTDDTKEVTKSNKEAKACEDKFMASIKELQDAKSNSDQKQDAVVSERVSTLGYTYKIVSTSADNANKGTHIDSAISEMQGNLNLCGATDKPISNDSNTRKIVNGAGAVVGGIALGVGTAQVIKAGNRAKFDSEQESWMNDVGNHIRCYIGADEVGMYGDIISTEME